MGTFESFVLAFDDTVGGCVSLNVGFEKSRPLHVSLEVRYALHIVVMSMLEVYVICFLGSDFFFDEFIKIVLATFC